MNQQSTMSSSLSKGFGMGNNSSQMGMIKRSSSNKQRNDNLPSDRPSTAPSKNDLISQSKLTNNSSIKRLPSPIIKCIIMFFNHL